MNILNEKLMKRHVGYINQRDEYQKSELLKMISSTFITCYILLVLSIIISLVTDVIFNHISLSTLLLYVVYLFAFIYPSIYGAKVRKTIYHQYTESYDENHYKKHLDTLKLQSVNCFVFIIISELIYSTYGDYYFFNEPFKLDLLDLLEAIVNAVILTFALYFIGKLMIDKKY